MKNSKKPAFLKVLREIWPKDAPLARAMGYESSASIHKKVAGLQQWTTEDALILDRLTGGRIKAAQVCPDFFKKLENLAAVL